MLKSLEPRGMRAIVKFAPAGVYSSWKMDARSASESSDSEVHPSSLKQEPNPSTA